jgi:hypothetical protein
VVAAGWIDPVPALLSIVALSLAAALLAAQGPRRVAAAPAERDRAVPVPSRRTILKGSALALAGVASWGASALTVGGAGGAKAPTSLRLQGVRWRSGAAEPGRAGGRGELLDAHGRPFGSFASTRLAVPTAAGADAAGAELQMFDLGDGSLFGLGTPAGLDRPGTYAIVGGTGRYAGASGSYVSDQRPVDAGGDGTAEFEFTFTD